jgi:small subunit ribosomal protein S6
MRNYEIMFIVKPTLDEANIKKVAEDVKLLIEAHEGKVLDLKDMGQKELAYEIKKFNKGYYFLITLEGTAVTVDEFNRVSNLSEDIIRSLVIKLEK